MPPVQTDFRRERKVDYRYMQGIIGQFQGSDIYAIREEEFDIDDSRGDSRLIYALIDPDKPNLKLVNEGMWIGDMTSDGYVTLFDRSRFYEEKDLDWESEESLAAEVEEPMAAELPEGIAAVTLSGGKGTIPQVDIDLTSGRTVEDYLAGETLVDRFLREASF